MAGEGRVHYTQGSRNTWGWCQTSGTELVSNILLYEPFFFLAMPRDMWVSVEAQMVKNLPEMQETRVQSLGWEDPLEN